MNREERQLRGKIAANTRWGALDADARTAATSRGRAALEQRFLDEAGGDPKRAANLRAAHYQRMALKSAQSRRRKRAE